MGSVWLCMCGIDSKHFCVSVTHLTGIQLSPSSASRGKKCVPISKDLLSSWLKGLPCYKLKLPANTFSFVPPHLPSSLTPFPLASLSSHIPLLSHPSHLTSLSSHPSHLTSLPSHTLPSHIPPLSHPFLPPKPFQGDPNLHKLDFYAEKDAFFLYARADDTTKIYVSAQAICYHENFPIYRMFKICGWHCSVLMCTILMQPMYKRL